MLKNIKQKVKNYLDVFGMTNAFNKDYPIQMGILYAVLLNTVIQLVTFIVHM